MIAMNNAFKEGVGDRCRRVRVTEGNEVRVFGEAIDDGEVDELPMD